MSPIPEKPTSLSVVPDVPVSEAHKGLQELRSKIEKYRATLAPEKRSEADTLLASLEKTTTEGVQTSVDMKNKFLASLTEDQKKTMLSVERSVAEVAAQTRE